LEWVYFTDPVHLQGVIILPSFYPSKHIRHYLGVFVSAFLIYSIIFFYMELIGVNVGASSRNFTGIAHMSEESKGYVG